MKHIAGFWLGLAAVTIFAVLLAGCGNPRSSSSPSGASVSSPSEASSTVSSQAKPNEKTAGVPRRIIYSANITLAAESLVDSARDIESKVKVSGGYIAGSELGGSDGERRTGTWTVRVPVPQFESFLKSLHGIGDIISTKVSSEDVSEEFYDIEARLRNKQAEEARLLLHLKASTAQLSDILAVEREISRVREEIERIQGRLRFLTNQTDLTTITITVREIGKGTLDGPPFLSELGRTFATSLRAMGDFARGLALFAVGLLPWLVVASGVGIPFYIRRRRRHPAISAQRNGTALRTPSDRPYE